MTKPIKRLEPEMNPDNGSIADLNKAAERIREMMANPNEGTLVSVPKNPISQKLHEKNEQMPPGAAH